MRRKIRVTCISVHLLTKQYCRLSSQRSAHEINLPFSPLSFFLPTQGKRQAEPVPSCSTSALQLLGKPPPSLRARGIPRAAVGLLSHPSSAVLDQRREPHGGAGFTWKLAVSSSVSWQGSSGDLSKCLGNLPVGSPSAWGTLGLPGLSGSQRLIGRQQDSALQSWKKLLWVLFWEQSVMRTSKSGSGRLLKARQCILK